MEKYKNGVLQVKPYKVEQEEKLERLKKQRIELTALILAQGTSHADWENNYSELNSIMTDIEIIKSNMTNKNKQIKHEIYRHLTDRR